MKRVNLDNADAAVRKFLKSIAMGKDGVELELNGQVIGKLLPPFTFSDAEKKALVEQRWQLIRPGAKTQPRCPWPRHRTRNT